SGVLFNAEQPGSAIFVARSNWPNGGSFYHSPAPDPFQEYRTQPLGRPASDADPNIFHDKQLMTADAWSSSPKRNRVYVTWTREEFDGPNFVRAPIVFSQSRDGGATWSPQVIISGSSASFCTVGSGTPGNPNACDVDQGSDPVVGPDGTIYVSFANQNTPQL